MHLDVEPDGGRRTWVCRAHPGEDGVRVESVDRLDDLPGGFEGFDAASRSLVAKILDAPRSVWGLDFAFALPLAAHGAAVKRSLAGGVADPISADWRMSLDRVLELTEEADLEPACDPDSLSAWSRGATSPGSGVRQEDLRRALRGIAGVLVPLLARSSVVVLPMDPLPVIPAGTPPAMAARAPSIFVLEVDAFRRLAAGDRADPARDGGAHEDAEIDSHEARSAALETLHAEGMVRPMQRALRLRIAEDPGALLATSAAAGAWHGFRSVDHASARRDPRLSGQGYPYA